MPPLDSDFFFLYSFAGDHNFVYRLRKETGREGIEINSGKNMASLEGRDQGDPIKSRKGTGQLRWKGR